MKQIELKKRKGNQHQDAVLNQTKGSKIWLTQKSLLKIIKL